MFPNAIVIIKVQLIFLFASFFILWSNVHCSHKICCQMNCTQRVNIIENIYP